MMELRDGMLLYHGSYTSISDIDLSKCMRGLDFGTGFYLTSSFEQAYSYVPLSVRKAVRMGILPDHFKPEDGQISVYRFHYDPNLLMHSFRSANPEWLHFVSANRNRNLFPDLLRKYQTIDIIAGKIADDQTARVLQQYIGEYFGKPGLPETDADVIKRLLPERLQDQFCFRTADAINSLEFIRSDRYGDFNR